MTDRKEWSRELMENNGVSCKDDEWRWGIAKTVVHNNPSKDIILYEASLNCSPTQHGNNFPQHHTGIVDSGATHIYIAPSAPHGHPNTKATPIAVGTASGQMVKSTATATLPIPQSAAEFPTTGYIMPSFTNTLIGVGPIYDADCKVLLTKKDVVVISPEGKTILTGWREKTLPKLWQFSLKAKRTGNNRHNTKPNRSSGTQCVLSAKIGSPREIHACISRISSEIHMA